MAATANLPATLKCYANNFVQGTDSAGTYKTVASGATNGTKVTGLLATTTDGSAAHLLTVAITRSAVVYIIGAVTIPVNAGTTNGVPVTNIFFNTVNALPIDNDGQPYLFLQSGDSLQVTYATALTASTRIDVVGVGADF